MRVAVISDIHGNLEAFHKVLADIDDSRVDSIVCLGDNVGYGPKPLAVVQHIQDRGIPSVMGNHELALTQPAHLRRMNPSAAKSMTITRALLCDNASAMAFIGGLKPFLIRYGARFVHGCPPASVTRYLFAVSDSALRRLFVTMKQKICFAGHTHDLEIICFDGTEVARQALEAGITDLREEARYIVNVGSVGQPRDGNNNAKYVIWDTVSGKIDVRFIPYDIARTAEEILALGFPAYNATRLW